MNAVTTPPFSSSVNTDEHNNNTKERGNLEARTTETQDDAEDTLVQNTSQKQHDDTVNQGNFFETRYPTKTYDNTEVHNDNLTRDNTQIEELHKNNTHSYNETEPDEKDNKTTVDTTTQNDIDSRLDTFTFNHDTSSSIKEENESETRYPQKLSNTEDQKVEEPEKTVKDDNWVTRDEILDNHDDQKIENRAERSVDNDNANDNTQEETESETRYPQKLSNTEDQKVEESEKNVKDDNWITRDDNLDNRDDTKIEAPEDKLWNETSTFSEPEAHDYTKTTENKNDIDDDTFSRTSDRLVVEDENDTRDTFSVSTSEDDIRDSLSISASEIETYEKKRTDDDSILDDDTLIRTEKLVIDGENNTHDRLSVPSQIETYKQTDEMVIDDTFNRTEKLVIDDENDTLDTHTLSVPSHTDTHYKRADEKEAINDETLIHSKSETRYDIHDNQNNREDIFSLDKNNSYDRALVSHDDEKEGKAVELEPVQDNHLDDELADLSPGMILHQAREQQKMSVKHIADRLYLDVHVIEALEADDYETLPPTIFVRGYLRNYAKLLEVPIKSIMVSFDKLQQPREIPVFTPPSKPKKQASSRDLLPTLGTFAIFMALIIGVALWQFYPTAPDSQLGVNPATPGEPFPPLIDEPLVNTELGGEEINPNPLGENPTSNPSNPDETRPDGNNEGEEPIPEPSSQTMQVRFKERAWVRISDKTGKRLYQGIGNAGEILPLEGTQPFYLQVGNVDGVSVEYNGEIKDIINYPRQRKNKRIFIVGSND